VPSIKHLTPGFRAASLIPSCDGKIDDKCVAGPIAQSPRWVKPQLCKLVDAPPQGMEWLHEIKLDGYRMHARLDRGRVSLLTRTAWGPGSSRSAGASRALHRF